MRVEKSLQGLKGEDTKRCPECKSKDIVREKDEIYCKNCGYVIEQ
jgi:ribosomal protein L37AE/L43A